MSDDNWNVDERHEEDGLIFDSKDLDLSDIVEESALSDNGLNPLALVSIKKKNNCRKRKAGVDQSYEFSSFGSCSHPIPVAADAEAQGHLARVVAEGANLDLIADHLTVKNWVEYRSPLGRKKKRSLEGKAGYEQQINIVHYNLVNLDLQGNISLHYKRNLEKL